MKRWKTDDKCWVFFNERACPAKVVNIMKPYANVRLLSQQEYPRYGCPQDGKYANFLVPVESLSHLCQSREECLTMAIKNVEKDLKMLSNYHKRLQNQLPKNVIME
jgi:hypothetical protein